MRKITTTLLIALGLSAAVFSATAMADPWDGGVEDPSGICVTWENFQFCS